MLILDKFFLKYEGWVNLTPTEKTTLKKPSPIRVKQVCLEYLAKISIKFIFEFLLKKSLITKTLAAVSW